MNALWSLCYGPAVIITVLLAFVCAFICLSYDWGYDIAFLPIILHLVGLNALWFNFIFAFNQFISNLTTERFFKPCPKSLTKACQIWQSLLVEKDYKQDKEREYYKERAWDADIVGKLLAHLPAIVAAEVYEVFIKPVKEETD